MAVIVDGKEMPCENPGDVSDGYHTFEELYDHRCLLFINLCLTSPHSCVWMPHGYKFFLLYFEAKSGQISYHLPVKFLPLVEHQIRKDEQYVWDGHNSADVLERLNMAAQLKKPMVGFYTPMGPELTMDERCDNCGAAILGSHGCND